MLTPLRRPQLRRLVDAQFFSELGDGVVTVALPLYARSGSALATAMTFAVQLLSGAVLGFVGGVLADGFDRQRILVMSYLARGALLVGAFGAGPPLVGGRVWGAGPGRRGRPTA